MGPQDTLDAIAKDLRKPEKLSIIGEMASGFIQNHIYTGDGFDPLSAATVSYRGQGKPLQDTMSLLGSITSEVIRPDTVSVGTTKKYAPVHNNGAIIRAKKQWLWIPASGTRQLERRYGPTPSDVCRGLKDSGHKIFRIGRTVCYSRGKGKRRKSIVIYYLKKSVVIPKREFFFLTESEQNQLIDEVLPNELL
jgi:phage gpG-like protein